MSQRFSFIRFILREKSPNTKFFSGPYFPVFGLNMEIYGVIRQKLYIWTIFAHCYLPPI